MAGIDKEMSLRGITFISTCAAIFCVAVYFFLIHIFSGHTYAKIEKPSVGTTSVVAEAPALYKTTINRVTSSIAPKTKHRITPFVSRDPLPPDNTPWREVYYELIGRSEKGDKSAASRLFRDTLRCKTYLSIKKNLGYALSAYSNSQAPEQVLRNYDKKLATIENTIKTAAPVCSNVDSKDLDAVVLPVLRQAAALGDEMAANCYVDGTIFQRNGATPDQVEAAKTDYAQHALQFVDNGIESGNWVMVSLMEQAYGNTPPQYGGRGWLGDLVKPDPLTMYAYMLLEQNGKDSAAAARVDYALSGIRAANHFSPIEIAAAETWAKNVYTLYFAGHTFPKENSMTICGLQ